MYSVKYLHCNKIKKSILFLGMMVVAVNSNAIGFQFSQWTNGKYVYYNSSNNPFGYANGHSAMNPLQQGDFKMHPNQLDLANLFVIPVVMEDETLNVFKPCNAVIMGVQYNQQLNEDILLLATTFSCGAYVNNGAFSYAIPHVDYVPSVEESNDYSYVFKFKAVSDRGRRIPVLRYDSPIGTNMARVNRIYYGRGTLGSNIRPNRLMPRIGAVVYFAMAMNPGQSAISQLARNMGSINHVFPNIIAPTPVQILGRNINEVHLASYGNNTLSGLGKGLMSQPLKSSDGFGANMLNVVYEGSGVLNSQIGEYQVALMDGDDGGYIALGFSRFIYPNIAGMLNFASQDTNPVWAVKTLVNTGRAYLYSNQDKFVSPNVVANKGYQFFRDADLVYSDNFLSHPLDK